MTSEIRGSQQTPIAITEQDVNTYFHGTKNLDKALSILTDLSKNGCENGHTQGKYTEVLKYVKEHSTEFKTDIHQAVEQEKGPWQRTKDSVARLFGHETKEEKATKLLTRLENLEKLSDINVGVLYDELKSRDQNRKLIDFQVQKTGPRELNELLEELRDHIWYRLEPNGGSAGPETAKYIKFCAEQGLLKQPIGTPKSWVLENGLKGGVDIWEATQIALKNPEISLEFLQQSSGSVFPRAKPEFLSFLVDKYPQLRDATNSDGNKIFHITQVDNSIHYTHNAKTESLFQWKSHIHDLQASGQYSSYRDEQGNTLVHQFVKVAGDGDVYSPYVYLKEDNEKMREMFDSFIAKDPSLLISPNHEGKTPLALAREAGKEGVARLLEETEKKFFNS